MFKNIIIGLMNDYYYNNKHNINLYPHLFKVAGFMN